MLLLPSKRLAAPADHLPRRYDRQRPSPTRRPIRRGPWWRLPRNTLGMAYGIMMRNGCPVFGYNAQGKWTIATSDAGCCCNCDACPDVFYLCIQAQFIQQYLHPGGDPSCIDRNTQWVYNFEMAKMIITPSPENDYATGCSYLPTAQPTFPSDAPEIPYGINSITCSVAGGISSNSWYLFFANYPSFAFTPTGCIADAGMISTYYTSSGEPFDCSDIPPGEPNYSLISVTIACQTTDEGCANDFIQTGF
jgi:hypothetical protein